MKKKWFDLKIFREGFRQLSLMALLFLAFILLTSLISILSKPLSYEGGPRILRIMTPLNLQPVIFVTFCLAAPFLTLKAFRFTTERRGSDFYHALPQRRECVFLSLLGAVFAWVILILLSSALISGGAASCFPAFYQFSWEDLLHYNLSLTLISLYVAAVTACGIFLSGTMFSNVLISLLLLFAPRIIIHTMTACIADYSPMLDRDYLPFPFRINLFSDFFYNTLNMSVQRFYSQSIFQWTRILYTFFAVLAWVLGGVFLARRRESEAAETPVDSPLVRAMVRISLAFLIWLIPLRSLLGNQRHSSFDYGIFALLILLAFFGYELLATRSLKSLKKILPSFGILAALCLGSLLLCRSSMQMAENWQPKAEDIRHVRIMDAQGNFLSGAPSFFNSRIEETRITDKAVHQLVADLLKRTHERIYNRAPASYQQNYTGSKIVAVKSGLTERYRVILLEEKEFEILGEALSKDEAFVKTYMELPDEKDPTIIVDSLIQPDEDHRAALQIYRCLKEEVKEIGFTEWFSIQNNPVIRGSNASLRLQSNRQGIASSTHFTISNRLPRTWALYQQLWADTNRQNRDRLLQWIDRAQTGEEGGSGIRIQRGFDLNIRAMDLQNGEDYYGDYWISYPYYGGSANTAEAARFQELRDILSGLTLPAGLDEEYYGSAHIDIHAYSNEGELNCTFTAETIPEKLKEFLK